jgi:hypothetical protein
MQLTVPVVIDAADVPTNITRAIYFSFEAVEPADGWSLNIGNLRVPFFMLGISGVIQGAVLPESGVPAGILPFLSPEFIESTFFVIERTGALAVVTARLWFPTAFLRMAKQDVARQDVFRIRRDVFATAHRITREVMQGDNIERYFAPYGDEYLKSQDIHSPESFPVVFSREETVAFQQWTNRQIEQAAEHYREQIDSGTALSYIENYSEPF